jgi:polyisoprenoid-binding protein YceI
MFRLILAFLLVSFPVSAAVYEIEPGHTRVNYKISHLGYSYMPGTFNDIKGTIHFDDAKVEESSVNVTIATKSVTMDHDVLDGKLLSETFFNAEKYPTITFKSVKVEKTGDDRGSVTGDLTLLGVTKPVTLKVKFNKKAVNPYVKAEMVGFSAWGQIKRSDFGMSAYLPDVGDEVFFSIQAEAVGPKIEEEKPVENKQEKK